MRPGSGCNTGSSGALRVRHASRVRVQRGLSECPPGAPRVLGAGAARAHRVPCGCATRPGCECSAGSSSALRVRHASLFRECPNDLLEGAARWRVPKGPGQADLGPAQGRSWASSMLVGLVVHCLSPIWLTGHVPTGNLRAVVWEPCFPYHRQQSRQKSYADTRRRELTFHEGDYVYLKVSPMRGMRRFKVKGKLSPRFIGPFKILSRKGEVAYQLELPPQLSDVHDVFHISQLKKCLRVPEEQLPMEEVNVEEDLSYAEYPVKILETSERVTRNRSIKMCKVQWRHHSEEEATWEREEDLKAEFPFLFPDESESRGRDSF